MNLRSRSCSVTPVSSSISSCNGSIGTVVVVVVDAETELGTDEEVVVAGSLAVHAAASRPRARRTTRVERTPGE